MFPFLSAIKDNDNNNQQQYANNYGNCWGGFFDHIT